MPFGWLAGRALDLFEVRGPEEGSSSRSLARRPPRSTACPVPGEESLDALLARRLKASSLPQKPLPGVATKVVIDNDAARDHSVIDVFTADRVGLLYTIADTAYELGVSVDLAQDHHRGTSRRRRLLRT